MNKEQEQKVDKNIEKMAQQIGIPVPDLEKEFIQILERVQGSSEEIKVKRTITILKNNHRELRTKSTAIKYNVVILGQSGVVDFGQKRWNKMMEEYKTNPGIMQSSGAVIVDGDNLTFIDKQETYKSGKKNLNYGKPIPEHSLRNTLRGIVKKPGEDTKWHPATINMYEDNAKLAVETGIEYTASFNGKFVTEASMYILNGATITKFENPKTFDGSLTDTIESAYGDKIVDLADLEAYHGNSVGNFNAFLLADVRTTFVGTTKTDKTYARVADGSLESDQSIMCFCNTKLNLETNKGYLLFGTVSKGKGYDSESKTTTNEVVYNINAQGFIPLEE